jgi:AGZA family xanthine/uracil permease-like MFS transporter
MREYFRLDELGTNVRTELLAGVATFMTMAYIVFVNPAILSAAGVPLEAAAVATAIAAGVITIAMGLATNYPLALASGMGLNAIVAYTIALEMGAGWQVAMGVVVVEGILVLILSATKVRSLVMDAIPLGLKYAIGVGIGLFIAFIGLSEANIVVSSPVTLVRLGDLTSTVALIAVVGLLVTSVLVAAKVSGGILWGILITAFVGMGPAWYISVPVGLIVGFLLWKYAKAGSAVAGFVSLVAALAFLCPEVVARPTGVGGVVAAPQSDSFSTFFAADILGALKWTLVPIIFALFMTDFFDTMGTAIGVGQQAGFVDEKGRIPRLRELLIVDSCGAVGGGLSGCSSVTSYIESAAGVAVGGRSGLTAVTVGVLFLLTVFFAPLISIVGGGVAVGEGAFRYPVTAPALIVVGFLMMRVVREIDFSDAAVALPAFLTILMMPLTYNITYGVGAGFVSHVVMMLGTGRAKEVKPLMYVSAALFAAAFVIDWIGGLIT